MVTRHRLLVTWSRKSRSIHLIPLLAVRPLQTLNTYTVELNLYTRMGLAACTEPQCLYSTAIPLLPLCAVRPVQSLSACTVQLYLYSPYVPYSLYRTSVPVECSYTSTPPYVPYGLYRASVPVQGRALGPGAASGASKKKYLSCLYRGSNPNCPSRSLIATLTTPFQPVSKNAKT